MSFGCKWRMRVGTLSSGRLVPPGKRVFDFGSDGFGGGVWESEKDMGKWVVKRGCGCGCGCGVLKRSGNFGSDGFEGEVWESKEDMGKWLVKPGCGYGVLKLNMCVRRLKMQA